MLTKPQPYEAVTPEARTHKAKTHEAEARTHQAEARTHQAEGMQHPRGRGQVHEAAEV